MYSTNNHTQKGLASISEQLLKGQFNGKGIMTNSIANDVEV